MVHPRGLFLIFCISFILGDIIGVSSGFWSLDLIFCICLYSIGIFSHTLRIYSLVGLLLFLCGSLYGNASYSVARERVAILEQRGLYAGRKYITGTVEKALYSKDRSTTYRLLLDKIDNRSTDIFTPSGSYSLFIEIPSNLDISIGDEIAFTGKVQKILEFPLTGYSRYAFYQGGYGAVFLPTFSRIYRSGGSYFDRVSSYWVDAFQRGFPQDVSSILLGITIGVDSYLSSETKTAFIKSGVSHILVVSGSNIAFLIFFLMFFLKYIAIGKYGRISIIGGSILLYSSLVGWDVSVVRATIMGILSYIIAEYGGRASSISTLALAGFILTLYSPLSPVYDAGFGLSFAATAGILIFRTPLEGVWKKTRFSPGLLPFISATLGATLGSLPVMIYHFGIVPFGTIIINILIACVLGWILFLSILYVPILLISSTVGYYFGYLIYIPTKYILILADHFQYGLQLEIPEEWRSIVTLMLLGYYTTLMVEKSFREQRKGETLDS